MNVLQNKKIQLGFIIIISLLLNINTVGNKYALDDELVIKKNMLVQQGFAGIGSILAQDSYKPYFNYVGIENPNLPGGRYRPLSIVSFAIEQQLFGKTYGADFIEQKEKLTNLQSFGNDPKAIDEELKLLNSTEEQMGVETMRLAPIRHFIQILLFVFCCIALFNFLQLYFSDAFSLLPFLATLLFACHPVHTEVIANLKSRDEILSLWFILLSCIYFTKYFRLQQAKNLGWALLFYILAFLSKEYAFALIIIVPFCYYITNKTTIKGIFTKKWFWVLAGISVVFILIRQSIIVKPENIKEELLNDPYLLASTTETIASKIAVLIEYLRILVFPKNLSSDYSYSTFAYVGFDSLKVWISFISWTIIAAITILLIKRKHILSIAFVWLLVFFLMINNLLFDIGATMGERLIFHSSVGFCIIISWLIISVCKKMINKVSLQPVIATAIILVLLVPMSIKKVSRNSEWKDNYTLFTTDVGTVPNSALANSNAGLEYFTKGRELVHDKTVLSQDEAAVMQPYIVKANYYQSRAIAIYPKFVNAYINRAIGYFLLNKLDSATADWKAAVLFYGNGRNAELVKHAQLLLNKGLTYGSQKDYVNAIRMFEPATIIDPYNAMIWDNLGGAYFMTNQMKEAAAAFEKALQLNPNLQDAQGGLNAARQRITVK